jgi:hypothetical protein
MWRRILFHWARLLSLRLLDPRVLTMLSHWGIYRHWAIHWTNIGSSIVKLVMWSLWCRHVCQSIWWRIRFSYQMFLLPIEMGPLCRLWHSWWKLQSLLLNSCFGFTYLRSSIHSPRIFRHKRPSRYFYLGSIEWIEISFWMRGIYYGTLLLLKSRHECIW